MAKITTIQQVRTYEYNGKGKVIKETIDTTETESTEKDKVGKKK